MIKNLRNSLTGFMLLSLLVHFGAVGVLKITKTKPRPVKKEVIEIQIQDSASTKARKQLIEQDEKQLNDEVPDESAYMGRHNQRVVKETKAANHGDYKNTAGQGQPQTAAQEKPVEKQQQTPPAPKESKKAVAKSKFAEGTLPSMADLKPKFKPSMQRQFDDIPRGQGGEVSKNNDHLDKVESGLETMLNSREFIYYTYYQRIRAQIRQYWEPSIREKVRKVFAEGRTIASTHNHITRVIIVLDRNGALQKVQVVGESGVHDLDDAAVEAFRAAEPFPNPPQGMIESDGTIRIQWDFILEA